MRLVDSLHQNRREVLATELAQARRDLELEVTGTLARAAAQAQDLREGAAREARAARAATWGRGRAPEAAPGRTGS